MHILAKKKKRPVDNSFFSVLENMEEMICDFFIILVHSVLRDRGVYPKVKKNLEKKSKRYIFLKNNTKKKELFEEVRHDQIKSMPVPICRHPSVTRYVYESVSDLRPLLSQVLFFPNFFFFFQNLRFLFQGKIAKTFRRGKG